MYDEDLEYQRMEERIAKLKNQPKDTLTEEEEEAWDLLDQVLNGDKKKKKQTPKKKKTA